MTSIEFQISNAAAGEAIDMTPGNTVIKYGDKNQTLTLNSITEFSASNIASFGDSDYLLEVGEVSRSPFKHGHAVHDRSGDKHRLHD